ncbi:MAG: histidine kinase dimerization/phospho-acceptor domain-containing protein [Nodosilinea sp.]
MALPPLDYFLNSVPAYGLVTPLDEIAHALGQFQESSQNRLAAPSHIIVVDDEHRPLGALALAQLWARHQSQGLSGANAELRLFDCQPWLEPVVEVTASPALDTSALSDLGRLAQQMPPRPLVAVDSDGQYVGVLNPVQILSWLAIKAESGLGSRERGAGPPEPDTTGVGEPFPITPALGGGGQRVWVLELSHALKTPMTTLLGLSTLLLDSRVGSLNERQFRYVSLMQQAIRKLTGLVNLLLDWMRLESGQISLNLERVYLQPLADELVPSFLSAHPALKATATWAEDFAVCLATAESYVQADPLRLRQSLHYVLSYLMAHGATPKGLIVEPWGAWLGITLWSSTAIATLGPPLEAVVAGDRRSPLDSQPEPESLEGLGVGLARRFSQLQGGELSGHSTPAWGSRITLLLPTPALHNSETLLVLLASASQTIIEQIYSNLRGSPYRLVVAPNCQTMAALQARLAPLCTLIHWESLADAPADAAACLALVQRLAIPGAVNLRSARVGSKSDPNSNSGLNSGAGSEPDLEPAAAAPGAASGKTLFTETLAQRLRPTLDQICLTPPVSLSALKGVTMLLLRPAEADGVLPSLVQAWLQRYHCRLLQVDDLRQANLLSRVWQPQAVILDGAVPVSIAYLQALAHQPDLACLPLVAPVPPVDWETAQTLDLPLVACPEVLTQPLPQALVSLIRAIALARSALAS